MCIGCKEVLSGAAGLFKAAAGIDQAPVHTQNHRRGLCGACPHLQTQKTLAGLITLHVRVCGKCNCFIAPKTAIASEECPLEGAEKRWGATLPAAGSTGSFERRGGAGGTPSPSP